MGGMAELAAASSAAGLISLGLEVCSGLVRYCSAWTSYDKDHQAALRRLKGLCHVLKVLDQVLGSSDLVGRPSFQIVHDNILGCASGINDLKELAKKLWIADDTTTSEIRKQVKRARYPMRKGELSSLDSTLNDLQSNLGLALQVAQSDQMNRLIEVQRSQHHQALGQFSSISIQLQTDLTIAKTTLQKMEEIEPKVDELFLALQANAPPQPGAIEEPNRAAPGSYDIANPKRALQKATRLKQIDVQDCSCKSMFTATSSWDFKIVRLSFEQRSRHHPACPIFRTTQRHERKDVRLCLPFFSRAVGYYISVDVLIGAGGARLQHRMACRRVVPRLSPCLRLFPDPANFSVIESDQVHGIRKGLSTTFTNGEASPNDVDLNGQSLLHQALKMIDDHVMMPDALVAWLLLIDDIIQAGTPINEPAISVELVDAYPIDYILTKEMSPADIHAQAETNALRLLLDKGADPSLSTIRHLWDPTALMVASSVAKDLEFTGFHTSILEQCLPRLLNIVKEKPDSIQEILPGSQNGAHVASNWPEGLELLIQAGIDINIADQFAYRPINWALESRSHSCVSLLISADCALPCSERLFREALHVDESFGAAAESYSMARTIATAIANRRKRLKQLAQAHLPTDQCVLLGLHEDSVLDKDATRVQAELRKREIDMPPALSVRDEYRTTIYHCVHHLAFTIDIADYLWGLGFRDTHQQDSYGGCPLSWLFWNGMASEEPELFKYILQKSRLISWILEKSGHAAQKWLRDGGHCTIAANLGDLIKRMRKKTLAKFSRNWVRCHLDGDSAILALLFGGDASSSHGQCTCSCAPPVGCRPLDRFFRIAEISRRRGSEQNFREKPLALAEVLRQLLDTSPALWSRLAPEIIRIFFFEWLEMEHTCCKPDIYSYTIPDGFVYREHTEAQELREEHVESIERFETLLPVVIEEYWASHLDLMAYLKGPFTERVDNMLKAQYDSGEEYLDTVFKSTLVRLERDVEVITDSEEEFDDGYDDDNLDT